MTACLAPVRKRKRRQRFVLDWLLRNNRWIESYPFIHFNHSNNNETETWVTSKRISFRSNIVFHWENPEFPGLQVDNCRGVYIWVMMQTRRYFYKYTKIGNDCLCWSTLAFRRHTFCSWIRRWQVVTACQSWYCVYVQIIDTVYDTVYSMVHVDRFTVCTHQISACFTLYLEFWFWACTHCPCMSLKLPFYVSIQFLLLTICVFVDLLTCAGFAHVETRAYLYVFVLYTLSSPKHPLIHLSLSLYI